MLKFVLIIEVDGCELDGLIAMHVGKIFSNNLLQIVLCFGSIVNNCELDFFFITIHMGKHSSKYDLLQVRA